MRGASVDEESYTYKRRTRFFRRKRRVDQASSTLGLTQSVTPELEILEAARRDSGLFCKECRKYRRWGQMYIRYSYHKKSDAFWMYWFCMSCDNMLGERDLSDREPE
jgi:hypothetical protein